MACWFDQTLRRPRASMILCRVASSRWKDGGMITRSTSTRPENGAEIASTLNIFTCQRAQLLHETAVHTQNIHRMSDR